MVFSDIVGTTKVSPWSSTRGTICIETQKVHTNYVAITKSSSQDNHWKDNRAPALTSTLALLIHQIRAQTLMDRLTSVSMHLFLGRNDSKNN